MFSPLASHCFSTDTKDKGCSWKNHPLGNPRNHISFYNFGFHHGCKLINQNNSKTLMWTVVSKNVHEIFSVLNCTVLDIKTGFSFFICWRLLNTLMRHIDRVIKRANCISGLVPTSLNSQSYTKEWRGQNKSSSSSSAQTLLNHNQ